MKNLSKYVMGLVLLPCVVLSAHDRAPEPQSQMHPSHIVNQITPPHGPLPNHEVDVILDAEFLWWFSTVGNMPYALVKEIILDGNTKNPLDRCKAADRMKEFHVHWDPGARVGLGIITNHDGWDVYADWTYFYNHDSENTSVPLFKDIDLGSSAATPVGTKIVSSPWFTNITEDDFNSVKADWSLLFHQFDLTLGRKYWISPHLVLHPYGGVRGHWSRLHLHVTGTFDGRENTASEDVILHREKTRLKQKFWAVGLLTGIDTTWHMTKNWSIYGEAAVALVYGCYDVRNRYGSFEIERESNNGSSSAVTANFEHTYDNDNIYAIQPVIDLGIGFRWETTFSNESYRLNLDLGWENHTWIDFNKFGRPLSDDFRDQSYMSSEGNLSMSGAVARARFEF